MDYWREKLHITFCKHGICLRDIGFEIIGVMILDYKKNGCDVKSIYLKVREQHNIYLYVPLPNLLSKKANN